MGLLLSFLMALGAAFSVAAEEVAPLPAAWVADFADPPNAYRLVQYQLNENTLEKYPDYGIGGAMAFFYSELYQQGEEGPGRIGPLVEAAEAQDFQVWLADDFGYPSGMAGGKVVAENPEYEVRGLARIVREGQGETTATLALPEGAERFVHALLYPVIDGAPDFARAEALPVTAEMVNVKGRRGDWRVDVFVQVIRDQDVQAQSTMQQFGHSGRYPDLMNREAVAQFLEHMHAPILARIADPARQVAGFYTNEPNLMQLHWTPEEAPFACLPWNATLPTHFKSMHGYDLLPKLGMLFEGESLDARRTRMHFHQSVADLLTQNFAGQIADWCAARGIASSGHFLLNEYLSMHVACYGDLMRFASAFHVPALDIGIPNPDRFDSFPYQQTRFFSAIASWKQRERVIMLLDPIIAGGGLQRLSPAMPLLYNSTNMGFFHGANLFTSYMPLDARQDGSAGGYTEAEYRQFNEYIGRLSRILQGAKRETAVALYYPVAMFQADYRPRNQHWTRVVPDHAERQAAWERVEHTLLDADLDYHIVHPDGVREAEIEAGVMRIGDGRFRYLIMPQVTILPEAVLRQLQRFEAGGGQVLWVDTKPAAGAYPQEDEAIREAMSPVEPMAVHNLAAAIDAPYDLRFDLRFTPGPDRMPVARFQQAGRQVYYLVNHGDYRLEVTVTSGREAPVFVLDPANGSIETHSLPATLDIAARQSLLIIE